MARKVRAGRCSTATWRRPVGAIGRPMVIALPGVARGGGRLPYCAREIGKAPCQLADAAKSGRSAGLPEAVGLWRRSHVSRELATSAERSHP
jgi:hypothetical protein